MLSITTIPYHHGYSRADFVLGLVGVFFFFCFFFIALHLNNKYVQKYPMFFFSKVY